MLVGQQKKDEPLKGGNVLCPLSFRDKHQQPSWVISPCGLHVFVPEPWCVFWGRSGHNLHSHRPCRRHSLYTQVYIQLKRPLMLNVFRPFSLKWCIFYTTATSRRSSYLRHGSKVPFCTHQRHKYTCFSKILNSSLHQKLTGSIPGRDSSSIQVSWRSVQEILWKSCWQTNRHGWRQNLLGGAKNRPFSLLQCQHISLLYSWLKSDVTEHKVKSKKYWHQDIKNQ